MGSALITNGKRFIKRMPDKLATDIKNMAATPLPA
jgi:hypothetical protein